jgi:hypothetical protein
MEEETKTSITPEVQALIDEAVANATKKTNDEWSDKFKTEVAKASKAERERSQRELEKSKLTESERIKADYEDKIKDYETKFQDLTNTVSVLTKEKDISHKKDLLATNKLPKSFIHDERLVNAKEEDLTKLMKQLSSEWNETLKTYSVDSVKDTSPTNGNKTQEDEITKMLKL